MGTRDSAVCCPLASATGCNTSVWPKLYRHDKIQRGSRAATDDYRIRFVEASMFENASYKFFALGLQRFDLFGFHFLRLQSHYNHLLRLRKICKTHYI